MSEYKLDPKLFGDITADFAAGITKQLSHFGESLKA
jgi:hypothetical protein